MPNKYARLFEPINIGKVEIKNRFAMAPMANNEISEHWAYTKESRDYYVERAKGGTGLIITGANHIENQIEKHMRFSFPCPTENPMEYMFSLRKMADKIHAFGAKLFVQLTAGLGRSVQLGMIVDGAYVSASDAPNRWDTSVQHRALTTEEVQAMINKFAESAMYAKMAGADGVQVHAVHEAYLLDLFAMALFNQRTDEFGGDLNGRLKFTIDALKAIKAACGEDFPVILRFGLKSYIKDIGKGALPGEDFKELGRDIEEGIEALRVCAEAGYDGFDVDAGSADSWYWAHPPLYFGRGIYLEFAQKAKETVDVPILTAGRMGYPDLNLAAIEKGQLDMVALGRPLIADPHYVNKMKRGQIDDIRPCLSCHMGCVGRTSKLRRQSCSINPQAHREVETKIEKADTLKKAVIVGGGPAGMEAARVLALRGHKVELIEQDNELGGKYRYAVVPEFKDDGKLLIKWYGHQLKKLGVKVSLQDKVNADDERLQKADVVITATGSSESFPGIDGIENAVSAVDVLSGKVNVDQECVIIGAGIPGCELAIWLAQHGKKASLVDMADKIIPAGNAPLMNLQMIDEMLDFYKVERHLSSTLKSVTDDGIVLEKGDKEEVLKTQKVIMTLGYRSENKLYKELCADFPEIYNIGDSNAVEDMAAGIWDAFELCSQI